MDLTTQFHLFILLFTPKNYDHCGSMLLHKQLEREPGEACGSHWWSITNAHRHGPNTHLIQGSMLVPGWIDITQQPFWLTFFHPSKGCGAVLINFVTHQMHTVNLTGNIGFCRVHNWESSQNSRERRYWTVWKCLVTLITTPVLSLCFEWNIRMVKKQFWLTISVFADILAD